MRLSKWFESGWFDVQNVPKVKKREIPPFCFENKTPAETVPKFPSIIHVIDRSDRNSPITARLAWRKEGVKVTLVAVIGGLRSNLSITRKADGNFLETFPRVLCFPKSRIKENGGKAMGKRWECVLISLRNLREQHWKYLQSKALCNSKFYQKVSGLRRTSTKWEKPYSAFPKKN